MGDRKEIIDAVESFYVDIIERYRDLERLIAGESRILTMFRKVDYKARIVKLKDLKKKVQSVNLKKIRVEEDDELAAEVKDKLGIAYSLFVRLIDAQVSCQTFLYKKSEGEKTDNIEYKKAVYNVRIATENLQDSLRNMDALYANLEENE
jgi:F0F1-type ATP synthase gamma subunit